MDINYGGFSGAGRRVNTFRPYAVLANVVEYLFLPAEGRFAFLGCFVRCAVMCGIKRSIKRKEVSNSSRVMEGSAVVRLVMLFLLLVAVVFFGGHVERNQQAAAHVTGLADGYEGCVRCQVAEVYDAAPRLCGQSTRQLVGVGGGVLGYTVGFQNLSLSLFSDLLPQAANSFA